MNTRTDSPHAIIQPAGWTPPKGYANGVLATGRQLFVGGQIGWNAQCQFESDDLVDQVQQALRNCLAVVEAAGGRAEHITRMTWYLVDKNAYVARLKDIGAAYREVMGRNFPAMTAVQVVSLVEDRALVEIEVTAVLP